MSPLLLIELIKKINWSHARTGTQFGVWLIVALVISMNSKIDQHISNNIKFRKETRNNMGILSKQIIKNQDGINYIQDNISNLEADQKKLNNIVITHGNKISILEDRAARVVAVGGL